MMVATMLQSDIGKDWADKDTAPPTCLQIEEWIDLLIEQGWELPVVIWEAAPYDKDALGDSLMHMFLTWFCGDDTRLALDYNRIIASLRGTVRSGDLLRDQLYTRIKSLEWLLAKYRK